jgi:WD40 repeat protein
MSRRHAAAAALAVVVLASGVGGWLLWIGRSPFGRAAASAPGSTAQTASTTAPDTTGGARLLWTLAGHTAPPASLAVSRDGTRVLSGGGHGDGAVRVWDITRGQPVTRFTGHGDKSDIIAVAVAPDGTTAISTAGPEDGSLRIWDLATGVERTQLSGDIGILFRAVSGDGVLAAAQRMTADGRSQGFSLWRLDEGRRIVSVDAPGHASALAISPDGRTVLSGGDDGTLTLWKATGEKIRTFVAHGPGTTVRAVAFAPSGRLLVTSGDGAGVSGTAPARAVILWDPETGVAFRTIRNATHFALADDGRTLAVAGDATSIRVLDVITARELARLEGHEGGVTALAFAPGSGGAAPAGATATRADANGLRLVSAGADRSVRIWALPGPAGSGATTP